MGERLLEDPQPVIDRLLTTRLEEHILEPDLERSIARRLTIFGEVLLRCFVSIGTPWTSTGHSDRVLDLGYGLLPSRNDDMPGLIGHYMASGVPVIHLLYVRAICRDFAIPWRDADDPPEPSH